MILSLFDSIIHKKERVMLREMRFKLFEKPIVWKRHKALKGGFGYDVQKEDKVRLRLLIKSEVGGNASLSDRLLEGPLSLDIKFFFSLPESKACRKTKGVYHINNKDLDNLVKFYCDVMGNGLLFEDDRLIFQIKAIKCYTTGEARTEVVLREHLQKEIEVKHTEA